MKRTWRSDLWGGPRWGCLDSTVFDSKVRIGFVRQKVLGGVEMRTGASSFTREES